MFLDWKREHFIRKTLKQLSRQRVGLILQPGNIWVVEKSLVTDEKIEAALRTCHIRGWVEPVERAIPKGKLTEDGKLPEGDMFSTVEPVYRLTEAGWNCIHRSHDWIVVTCIIACATLIASLLTVFVSTIDKIELHPFQNHNQGVKGTDRTP